MKKRIIIFVIILLIGALAVFGYALITKKISLFNNDGKTNHNEEEEPKEEEEQPPAPKLKIIDLDSKTRPIGIMVDNEKGAWPQAGLQEAFLIYEIIVEGGETRFFALFKDATTAMIGPDRSARHYFLDYAMENDAIFVHYGFSPQALADISQYKINNISGTQGDGKSFWREKVITTNWQNCFTSFANLKNRALEKKYRMETEGKPLLNYSVEEIDISTVSNTVMANKVTIPFRKLTLSHMITIQIQKYTNVLHEEKYKFDRVTGQQYTAKNIIVYNVRNYPLNDEPGKGRQGIENVGSGTGYYITNGYAMPIKWSKPSRSERTVYTDENGVEIKVNDGNTFIEIQPTNQKITFQ